MATQKRILLIDDDPDFVATTRLVLERHGYAVSSATDGGTGLEAARRDPPDLIILDVIMPFKNGFTVCEELKRDPALARIPVVMLTSFAERHHETDVAVSTGMGLEAEDYLDKPAPPDVLIARVARLLT
jgi:two-component system alkaline phosphatase synthesis response regulator PhoP